MHCVNCHKPLASDTDICEECDKKLWRSPIFSGQLYELARQPHVPDAGQYACPRCGKHFDDCRTILYPPNAPWWRPQDQVPACPHCEARVYWASPTPPSRVELCWRMLALACILVFFVIKMLYGHVLEPALGKRLSDAARLSIHLSLVLSLVANALQNQNRARSNGGRWQCTPPESDRTALQCLPLAIAPALLLSFWWFMTEDRPATQGISLIAASAAVLAPLALCASFIARWLTNRRMYHATNA